MPDKKDFIAAFRAMSTEASAITTDVVARIISGSRASTSDTVAVQMQGYTSPVDVAKFNRVSASATRRHLYSYANV